jgi:uncharacterized protein YdhG (YjbR/CyaY superfamily)
MRSSPESIDAYLAGLDADKRAALEKLHATIKAAAPELEECMSYQMPAFRYNGRVIVWYGAGAKHCAFYPGAHPIVVHEAALATYSTSKGTIRFSPEHPLPVALVRKLVKTRIAEYADKRPLKR